MRKETVDIIDDLLKEVNLTFKIDECIDNGDKTYTLKTCDTLHLQNCKEVQIDGRKYSIVDFKYGEYITVKGRKKPEVTEFEVYAPVYFHGKAWHTNAEIAMQDDKDLITPMVYFTEIYTDRFYPNDELVEREVDIRMFFLTSANYEDWKTDDHYSEVIRPMRNLVYNFINVLEKSKIIGKFASYYDLVNHAEFAIFLLRRGAQKRIFDDNYSGVEFKVRLPILKDMTCEGFCE
jgi:hypothetical protein